MFVKVCVGCFIVFYIIIFWEIYLFCSLIYVGVLDECYRFCIFLKISFMIGSWNYDSFVIFFLDVVIFKWKFINMFMIGFICCRFDFGSDDVKFFGILFFSCFMFDFELYFLF